MKPHKVIRPHPRRTAVRVVVLSLVAACGVGLVSGTASPPQDAPAGEEREFKSTVPEHVPIKVKLKNDQSFKKKENKNWARELEIEVKNTGAKPIYYLYVVIVVPDAIIGGDVLGFRVKYGRKELAFLDTPLEPEDVPIQPGESITLKIQEKQVRGYEEWREREKREPHMKVEFDLQIINFGDGTGLRGRDGRPYLLKKRAHNETPARGGGDACLPPPRGKSGGTNRKISRSLLLAEARKILAGRFLSGRCYPGLGLNASRLVRLSEQ